MRKKDGKLVSFKLKDETIVLLENESKKTKLSKTTIVENAVEDYVKKERRAKNEK